MVTAISLWNNDATPWATRNPSIPTRFVFLYAFHGVYSSIVWRDTVSRAAVLTAVHSIRLELPPDDSGQLAARTVNGTRSTFVIFHLCWRCHVAMHIVFFGVLENLMLVQLTILNWDSTLRVEATEWIVFHGLLGVYCIHPVGALEAGAVVPSTLFGQWNERSNFEANDAFRCGVSKFCFLVGNIFLWRQGWRVCTDTNILKRVIISRFFRVNFGKRGLVLDRMTTATPGFLSAGIFMVFQVPTRHDASVSLFVIGKFPCSV